ncbi:MAG TPA: NAD-dependent epimerase/dehydratase family protein [bacterium]|mgnify:CR=1 FL=1|nr:NAD-dependent epimerase/dehydratase family protein [bacterium]HPQ19475.1 NAD-dependent epimerase/dehydratase family protein [bacterium]
MKNDILFSDNWSNKEKELALKLKGPIFIIGCSGFIGANLLFSLLKIRDDVFGCSRLPKQSWRLKEVSSEKLLTLDITNNNDVKNIFLKYKPLTIFNLSAYGSYSRQNEIDKIHYTNYIGTLNLLRNALEIGCDAFVHAGSSSEYGLNCEAPKEDSELIPNSDYAVSKVGANYLIKYYGKIYNFPCVNLRLYSVYGKWEERDRLIPTLITNCLKGKLPNFVNKDISRDFVYIDDTTAALVKSAVTICKTQPGIVVNIGTGKKTTIEEIVYLAKKIFNIEEEPIFGSMVNRKWDLKNWYAEPSLAKKIMSWEYSTELEEGLKMTAAWEKEFEKREQYIYIPEVKKKISLILACYKDNQSIPIMYERIIKSLETIKVDYEIIFVNDGSPANDEEEIYKLCLKDNKVIGISHTRNFGSQSAFISGMEIARGDAVILFDGDGQDPPELISEFIKKWEEGYEVVYGERIKREAPLYMQFFYKLFYRIFSKLSDIKIPVDAGDFSLMDKKIYKKIVEFSEKDIFIRGLRAWVGGTQIGIPYIRGERLFGRSTNNFFKNIWWAKKGIFSFSMKPLYYIQSIGIILFIITLLLTIFYLTMYFLKPPINAKGTTTIILLILGIGSFQIIAISILGDYIAKIIEETKNRPKFIRNKILHNGKKYETEEEIKKFINDYSKYV